MKSILLASACALALGGCVNPLNLTAQQQTNLQLWIQAGKIVVQATTNLYCSFEPVTSQLIGVWDKSKGTTTFLGQLDESTVILCKAALTKGS